MSLALHVHATLSDDGTTGLRRKSAAAPGAAYVRPRDFSTQLACETAELLRTMVHRCTRALASTSSAARPRGNSTRVDRMLRTGTVLVALLALPACAKVENLAPATAQTAKLKGTGYTAVTIDTNRTVRRVDKVVAEKFVIQHEEERADGTYEVTDTYTLPKYVGPVMCDAEHSPCRVELPRGNDLFLIEKLESPVLPVGVKSQPLTLRVRKERNPAAGGIGFTLMGFGGLLVPVGIVQVATGHPRPDNVSRQAMIGRGLTTVAFGTALIAGGYLLARMWKRGEVVVAPSK